MLDTKETHCPSIMKAMNCLRQDRMLSDVCLIVGGEKIPIQFNSIQFNSLFSLGYIYCNNKRYTFTKCNLILVAWRLKITMHIQRSN